MTTDFDSLDFESFRRERNYRRQQTREMERPGGQADVWRQLEARERSEMKDEILTAEVDDFFADATRLAATIVKRVASSHDEEISDRLRQEMEEFLAASIRHATNMVLSLDPERIERGGESIVEPSVRNLLGKPLDDFRAEGTAQLENKHIGEDPFGTGLGAELEKSEDSDPAASTSDPASTPSDGDDASVDSAPGSGEIVERRIRFSDAELAVDFDPKSSSSNFVADEFDTRISGTSAIQRLDAPSPASADEDDMPLAASFEEEGTPTREASVAADFEGDAADPAFEAGITPTEFTAETEPPTASRVTPAASEAAETKPAVSEEDVRRALLMLVDQGIMTPEQARAAYRKQTQ